MNLVKAIKSMDFKQLWSLTGLCFQNPLYIWPTYIATRKTVSICDRKFGKKHHKNGPANAFRHALWNALIVHHSLGWARHSEKAISWAKKITDWHEDFSPNHELAHEMDLHNNRIGRDFVKQHLDVSEQQLIQLVMTMIPLSRKHTTIQQLKEDSNQLVHIEDD